MSVLAGREVLIVEDESLLRKRITGFLETEEASVTAVGSFEEGKNSLEGMSFDFALIDVHLPDGLGIDLLPFCKGLDALIMTADGGVETAVEAIKRGAADYISKPFELEELPLIMARCMRKRTSDRLRERRNEEIAAGAADGGLFFGKTLEAMRGQLDRILAADCRLSGRLPPVLIEGETGVGKSTIARWIHANGPRRDRELVVVNCATLQESLAESELFGHEKGAFTDAKEKRLGLFEAADGGTLFLDEVASLSAPLQAKVLVAIEEGKIRRVGGTREIAIDVRVLAASNRDLAGLVSEKLFREDLYHRLNLLSVKIPPLRERKMDLLELANHLLDSVGIRYRMESLAISDRGREQILSYEWPGNIRELAHELERAVILGEPEALEFPNLPGADGEIAAALDKREWLNPLFEFPREGFNLEQAIDVLIDRAIDQSGGNVSGAARLLGVPRDYIRYRKKKHS